MKKKEYGHLHNYITNICNIQQQNIFTTRKDDKFDKIKRYFSSETSHGHQYKYNKESMKNDEGATKLLLLLLK